MQVPERWFQPPAGLAYDLAGKNKGSAVPP
jgi:hypothetical protein